MKENLYKFVRLKGIPEDKHSIENTVEKVSELLEYLGFQIEEKDIERANRVGGGKDDDGKGPRAIVMELISERLKHSILREAAVKLRFVFKYFHFFLAKFDLHQFENHFEAHPLFNSR